MRILLIARHYPPEISGGARRPFLLAKSLRELGHSVSVVTPFAPQHADDHQVPGPPLAGKPGFQANSLLTWLVRWRYWPDPDIVWARGVAQDLKGHPPPDLILTTSPPESTHTAGAQLKRAFPRARWIAEFRDTWTRKPHRREAARWPRRPLEQRLARKTLCAVDGLVAVSDFVMDEVRHYAPHAARLIEGHVSDPPGEAHMFAKDTFNLVHSGGFALSDHRRKLVDTLIHLDPVAAARPDFRFHIAGWLDDEEALLADARSWIICHGLVDLAMSRALQAGADALLIATPPDSHALPGKFAEYAMAGRPIVVIGDGSWRRLLPQEAVLLTPDALMDLPAGQSIAPIRSLSAAAAAERFLAFAARL